MALLTLGLRFSIPPTNGETLNQLFDTLIKTLRDDCGMKVTMVPGALQLSSGFFFRPDPRYPLRSVNKGSIRWSRAPRGSITVAMSLRRTRIDVMVIACFYVMICHFMGLTMGSVAGFIGAVVIASLGIPVFWLAWKSDVHRTKHQLADYMTRLISEGIDGAPVHLVQER
jgi:hypothetical protein